jgi:hypothetical protein
MGDFLKSKHKYEQLTPTAIAAELAPRVFGWQSKILVESIVKTMEDLYQGGEIPAAWISYSDKTNNGFMHLVSLKITN